VGNDNNPSDRIRASGSRRVLISFLVLSAVFLVPREGEVRTWHIKADSTGDAPAIWEAVDSAATGDTILAGPGTYVVDACRNITRAVVLRSEAGAGETRIVPESPPRYLPLCAFYIDQVTTGRTEINGFWFDGHYYDGTGDFGIVNIDRCDSVFISNNVFTNFDGIRTAIKMVPETPSSHIYIENNTFVGGDYAVINLVGWTAGSYVRYNIMWSHGWGMGNFYTVCNCVLDISEVPEGINFEADPQFCGIDGSGNLFLQSDSPCAPGNPPWLEYCDTLRLIGALPVNCATTPVKATTWGAFKDIYR
jgi:hypothetical protein